MEDLRLKLMCGTDIPVPQCSLTLHQPKIWEIAFLGEKDFFMAIQCLTINKNMISKDENLLEDKSNFYIFMTIMLEKEVADKKQAVIDLLSIMIPNGKIIFTPRSMMINVDGQQSSIIDDSNFEIFQEAIKAIFCFNNGPMDQSNFNPANDQAKEIAEKLMRGRARVAAEKGDSNSSMFTQYISTLTVAIGSMSLNDCINLTMFQLLDLLERYSLYMSWDLDIRSRLAGGKPDSKPDNWMKTIH